MFRSLFRGREDVYPRRFESRRTGKSGYSPACANEWVRGLCDKRAVRCAECPNREFLPVTDEVVRNHLAGDDGSGREFVMGVYPMLLDETCLLLAADFDKASWQEDALAVWETCRSLDIPAAVERSRSGNGAHLWIFFQAAVPATLARRLGAHLLTLTMERRPDIGLDSYDRFFPNQDTLPRGGFGNLIALPLQKNARDRGNSVFVDSSFVPHADPWAFLSTFAQMANDDVESIVRSAEARGHVVGIRFALTDDGDREPWSMPPSRRRRDAPMVGPLPASVELILGNEIYISKDGLPPALRNCLIRLAAFQNPEFYRAQAMRLPTYDKPRVIACAEDHPLHIGLPRGCLDELHELLASLRIPAKVRDERQVGTPLVVRFHGQLRPDQRAAAESLAAHDTGVLSASTAFGKTVVAAWAIAHRGVSALILVHRQQLMEQWVDRLAEFLDVPAKSIGRIGGGRRKPTGAIDVALIQSLIRHGVVNDLVGDYGHLIVDECHHLPATSFEQVARRTRARYVLGLSATITRKDGHHPIVFMQCGPIRYRSDSRQQTVERPFSRSVRVRPTAFRAPDESPSDARVQFHRICDALVADDKRNRFIVEDIVDAVREGRSPIVLTERTDHLSHLTERLTPLVPNLFVLQGGMSRKRLREALARIASVPPEEERLLLATGRFVGEGFDDARLDTLFLTMPVSWRGTITQYAGRLHRLHEGKSDVRIYDYADLNVPMLERMFDRRCKGYESIGYSILLPASAVPGWPPEVPLPVEPEWKRDYAASIRRLLRDGVDALLGDLFVHATRHVLIGPDGTEIARSAAEAFLQQRLESLPTTGGRFHLNVVLPIPFDDRGSMEVDLLCPDAHLAIEVDGPHHLSDPDAYRRDRRKDALLQENGWFVLRFLADDIGKRLGAVLDTILRTLSHQSRARP